MHRSPIAASLIAVTWAAATSCAGPRLRVDAEPTGATIYVDGRARGTAPLTMPLPYYGTTRIEATSDDYDPASQLVALAPPVTGWLFPLDLCIESLLRPFQDPDVKKTIRLRTPLSAQTPQARGSAPSPSLTPAVQAELAGRARAVALER